MCVFNREGVCERVCVCDRESEIQIRCVCVLMQRKKKSDVH